MTEEPDYERIRDSVGVDALGTIRICEQFGTVAIYIKIGENTWHTVYADPRRGESLIPKVPLSDNVAGLYPVVFCPKPIA